MEGEGGWCRASPHVRGLGEAFVHIKPSMSAGCPNMWPVVRARVTQTSTRWKQPATPTHDAHNHPSVETHMSTD